MTTQRMFKTTNVNPLLALSLVILFVVALFYIAKGVFWLLAKAAPFLLIAAIILNYRVVWGYAIWLKDLLMRNPLMGIIAVVATIIGFPIVSGFLFLKSLSTKRERQQQPKFVPYEEVEDDFLDLSDFQKKNQDLEDKFKNLK